MNAQLKRYVEAAAALLKEGMAVDVVLRNLRRIMDDRGHGKMYQAVARALARTYPSIERSVTPLLTVAKESDAAKYRQLVGDKDVEVKIDPSIIGGYVLTENFTRRDNSYRSKLLTWYRSAIASK